MKKLIVTLLLLVVLVFGNTLAFADPYAVPDDPLESTGDPITVSTEPITN